MIDQEICSFDGSSQKYIIISNSFFPITEQTPNTPPNTLFKSFLKVLLEFSSFENHTGFYKQKSGVRMGAKTKKSGVCMGEKHSPSLEAIILKKVSHWKFWKNLTNLTRSKMDH